MVYITLEGRPARRDCLLRGGTRENAAVSSQFKHAISVKTFSVAKLHFSRSMNLVTGVKHKSNQHSFERATGPSLSYSFGIYIEITKHF